MASGTQNLTSYKARYLAGGIAEVQQHLNITGTTYFSVGTSVADGKPILAYNSANVNFGLRYFESDPDVLTISASGNNNSKTGADFSINGLGNGILSHLGNYIPHTGNTTGTVGGEEQPVYVNAGTISATSYALKATVNNGDTNYVTYYSNERNIASAKATTAMIMPAHYYHNLYNDNPTTGTTVYVHYYNGETTSTNTFANLRVKSSSSYKVLAFGGDGNCTWDGTITAKGGYLKSTANGNTVQIGSQNTGLCHITNSANIPFWFNKDIYIERGKTIGASGTIYRPFQIYLGRSSTADSKALNSNNPLIEFANTDRSQYGQIIYTDFNNQGGSDSFTFVSNQSDLRIYAPKVYNAVWNDYAETRATDITEPGRVVTEHGKIMTLANERLLPGCRIISDTYGTCMGREEDTPVAVSGRVLVYPYHNRNDYPLGAAVCSAPNGTVDIMTREEIINYPERIIGTVSEIPDYEYWGAGQDGKLQIAVNNRIWIYVR